MYIYIYISIPIPIYVSSRPTCAFVYPRILEPWICGVLQNPHFPGQPCCVIIVSIGMIPFASGAHTARLLA